MSHDSTRTVIDTKFKVHQFAKLQVFYFITYFVLLPMLPFPMSHCSPSMDSPLGQWLTQSSKFTSLPNFKFSILSHSLSSYQCCLFLSPIVLRRWTPKFTKSTYIHSIGPSFLVRKASLSDKNSLSFGQRLSCPRSVLV